jgi:hypothetical protein
MRLSVRLTYSKSFSPWLYPTRIHGRLIWVVQVISGHARALKRGTARRTPRVRLKQSAKHESDGKVQCV